LVWFGWVRLGYELIELQTRMASWLIWQTGSYGKLTMAIN